MGRVSRRQAAKAVRIAPTDPAPAPWRIAHGVSALGIIAIFLAIHLANFAVSTGVLPLVTTYFGPRTACAGFTSRTWPVTCRFANWCKAHGLHELAQVQPFHVAAFDKELQHQFSAPTVKQHLAALRMLFD